MELRVYLSTLWQVRTTVLLCTIITLIAASLFTLNEPQVYEATASFVMRPRAALVGNQQDSVRVLDILGRQVSIGSTYVEVASSQLIRERAGKSLALADDVRKNLTVDGQVVAGTNILRISVQGSNPLVIKEYANQIGLETVNYVSGLYDIFELEPLDAATTPRNPIKPNIMLNLILGAVVGMVLGVGIGIFDLYWRTPHIEVRHFDIVEPGTGAYNVPYFRLRLQQEVSRARRTEEPFSMALIQISKSRAVTEMELLRRSALFLQAELRDEDLLAYTGESVFALLLAGMTGQAARDQVERLCRDLHTTTLMQSKSGHLWDLKCSAGVSCYQDAMSDADELWTEAVIALTDANKSLNGKVNLFSQMEGVFGSAHPARWTL